MFGKKAKRIRELEEQIATLNETLEARSKENESLAARVRAFEEREHSIARALTEAASRAEHVVGDAQRQAGEILRQSKADSDAARRDAERIVDDAYENARDIIKDAETESFRRMDETQGQIEAYATILKNYDKLIQENIRAAEENARLYARMGQRLRSAIPQILSPDGKLIGTAEEKAEAKPETLPEEKTEKRSEASPVWEGEIKLPTRDDDEPDDVPSWDALDDDDDDSDGSSVRERLWTVSELSRVDVPDASVDAIIDGVIDGVSRK